MQVNGRLEFSPVKFHNSEHLLEVDEFTFFKQEVIRMLICQEVFKPCPL